MIIIEEGRWWCNGGAWEGGGEGGEEWYGWQEVSCTKLGITPIYPR